MSILQNLRPVSRPRWDGNRMTFTINDDNAHIRCAISRAALLDIAERTYLRPSELMDCFMQSRARIESLALAKFRLQHGHTGGSVNIWSDDIDPPPESSPIQAHATTNHGAA